MAAATCFYHPDQVASTACAQCSVPLCGSCVETVANKPVCRRCVDAIRARVASQMSAAPMNSAPTNSAASAPMYTPASPYAPPRPAVQGVEAGGDSKRLLLGTLAAIGVGVVGSILWEKIYFNLHFGISLIYLGIGIAVAWTLVTVSGRSGGLMSPLAMAITFVALIVGHFVLAYDVTGEMSVRAFTFVSSHLGPMHWVCVALGLFGAFRTIDRAA